MYSLFPVLLFAAVLVSTNNGATVSRTPVSVPGQNPGVAAATAGGVDDGFSWQLQGSFTQAVFIDIAMADDSVGFACAELGVVYRTTNSGANWTQVMSLGFPYYWYGVSAPSRQDVIVSGFNNTTGDGIYRWSHDGGQTWDSIVALDTAHWLSRAHFVDSLRGIICAGWTGGIWRTDSGGRNTNDWSYVQVDPAQGWFEGNFCYKPDARCYAAGISFCRSTNDGREWETQHSVDPVFDGAVWFTDSLHGWTGGGQISAPVSGWVHRTTDAGATWSDRLLETPAPVRAVMFLNDTLGFAVGGNIYSGAGFIYSTVNGGDSWRLDLNTGAEMKGIDFKLAGDSIDVWCCGFNSGFSGRIYRTRIGAQGTAVSERRTPYASRRTPDVLSNPARAVVVVNAGAGECTVSLRDVTGREVLRKNGAGALRLDISGLAAGWYSAVVGRDGRVTAVPVVVAR